MNFIKYSIALLLLNIRRFFCVVVWTMLKLWQYPKVLGMGRYRFDTNVQYNPEISDRYAILATQGKNFVEDGFYDLLEILQQEKINSVIIVNGKLSEESRTMLSRKAYRIITRPNFGRDMASFKEGSLYLHDILKQEGRTLKRMLYFNDSLIYLNTIELREMIRRLAGDDTDVMGVTQSFERHPHIGSFIFSMSEKAFYNPGILRYWEKYRQYNLRPHCIFKGEIGLSRCVRKQGFFLDCSYLVDTVANVLNKMEYNELLRCFSLVRQSYRSTFMEFLSSFSDMTCPPEMLRQSAIDFMFGAGNHSQVHVYFGLFYRLLRLPIIKKDILYKGVFDEKSMALILDDLPELQKRRIFKILNAKGRENEAIGFIPYFKRVLMLE